MTGNAKSTKHGAATTAGRPTLDDVRAGRISLDDYEAAHGEDIAELSEAALPGRSVQGERDLSAMFERARGQRGAQKSPVKERIGLRLDRDVVDHFRALGPGWQSRINDILSQHVKAGRS